ncbi:MAG: thioredoxin domain-containing protein [Candidatus Andersenbacteria bacterium]
MIMTSETKILAGVLTLTLLIIIGGAFLAGSGTRDPQAPVDQPERLVRADDPVLGPADAKVTVVEFGDFQCPACGALHPILQELKKNNAEQPVRFVYRHFPLTAIHEHAQLAAEAAVEAQLQGKFWEFHDVLFANQNKLDRSGLEEHAQTVDLQLEQFKRALDEGMHREAVRQDLVDAQALRLQGTPSLFINDVQFTGQYSLSGLQAAIDAVLGE